MIKPEKGMRTPSLSDWRFLFLLPSKWQAALPLVSLLNPCALSASPQALLLSWVNDS